MENIAKVKDSSQAKSALWELAQKGAKEMIQAALILEQEEFLQEFQKRVTDEGLKRFVKNGFNPGREILMPGGKVPVKAPRVRDRQSGSDDIRFESRILPKYLRKSKELDELIPFLYLKGVSTNDFSDVLSNLLGSETTLSTASVVGLKKIWHEEFQSWSQRDLAGKQYIYWWADGVYFKPRLEAEKTCVLVLIGATQSGEKELIAMQGGYRESELSWRELFLDLKNRGLESGPKLAIGDGALGFWKAIATDFPEASSQRCWIHKTANVLDKMPESIRMPAKSKIHEIYMAETKENALKAFDTFVSLYEAKYPKAVSCLIKDKLETLAFYDFPAEHWQHIRSTNPIESIFATIRLRTYKTKGSGKLKDTLSMAFKLVEAASKRWRKLRGFKKIPLVMTGRKFINGELADAA